MSVLADIVESWHRPRAVVARHLARGRSEVFLFSLLITFVILAVIAQAPAAAREAALVAGRPLPVLLTGRAMAVVATLPLWYLLAALGHLAAKARGGQGDGYGARLALFWALVAVSPLVLLTGLAEGLIGPGPQLWLVGGLTFTALIWQWISGLRVVGEPHGH